MRSSLPSWEGEEGDCAIWFSKFSDELQTENNLGDYTFMSAVSGTSHSKHRGTIAPGAGGWLKLNAHTLLLVLVLAGGWIANFATLSSRMSDVEKMQGKMDQRFDRDVVPRPEQEVRERMLDQRLAQMQRTLDAIQQELQRQRGR